MSLFLRWSYCSFIVATAKTLRRERRGGVGILLFASVIAPVRKSVRTPILFLPAPYNLRYCVSPYYYAVFITQKHPHWPHVLWLFFAAEGGDARYPCWSPFAHVHRHHPLWALGDVSREFGAKFRVTGQFLNARAAVIARFTFLSCQTITDA